MIRTYVAFLTAAGSLLSTDASAIEIAAASVSAQVKGLGQMELMQKFGKADFLSDGVLRWNAKNVRVATWCYMTPDQRLYFVFFDNKLTEVYRDPDYGHCHDIFTRELAKGLKTKNATYTPN